MTKLIIDADSLFFDAFSLPPEKISGFGPIKQVGPSAVPEEINDEIIAKGVSRARKRILEMGDRFYTGDIYVAVKGKNNFRYGIYPEYKASRGKGVTILRDLASYAIEEAVRQGFAIPAEGMEADDLARIWAEEARAAGEQFVVAHIDKDLDAIAGLHFNYRHNVTYTVEPEKALLVFYTQLLTGDASDSVPGCTQIGKVRAARIMEGAKGEEDMQVRVVDTYMSVYPEDWLEQLQLNGALLYLLKDHDDRFDCTKWSVIKELL